MKIENIKDKVWRRGDKFKVKIEFDVTLEDKHDKNYWDKEEVRCRVEQNSKWLAPQMIHWAGFDYIYTIHIFADSLIQLGKRLKQYETYIGLVGRKYLKRQERKGNRAIFAGQMLKKIYEKNYICDDVHWIKLARASRAKVNRKLKDKNIQVFTSEYSDYEEKMIKLIMNRCKKQEKLDIEWIWGYINKYIEYFWD